MNGAACSRAQKGTKDVEASGAIENTNTKKVGDRQAGEE